MLLEYPADDIAWTIEDQYMLGSALLVAPVLAPMDREPVRRVYLPRGTWYDYWTKERIESSGEWRVEQVRLDRIPLFVRGDSIIPYTSVRRRTENTVFPIVRVEAYEGTHVAGGKGVGTDTRLDGRGARRLVIREGDFELVWEFRNGALIGVPSGAPSHSEPELSVYRGNRA
jgi:alpha-glucosidase (family GH31 glycosyl hydrolase)